MQSNEQPVQLVPVQLAPVQLTPAINDEKLEEWLSEMIYVEYNKDEGWKFYDKDRAPEPKDDVNNTRDLISKNVGSNLTASSCPSRATGFLCKRRDIMNIKSYHDSAYKYPY